MAPSKLFFRCPVGGGMRGPYVTSDNETLLLAVQHPGRDGTKSLKRYERNSRLEDPATRWPDFDPAMPPRPSVVVVNKQGGDKIAVCRQPPYLPDAPLRRSGDT